MRQNELLVEEFLVFFPIGQHNRRHVGWGDIENRAFDLDVPLFTD
jgi:hypothetical protein